MGICQMNILTFGVSIFFYDNSRAFDLRSIHHIVEETKFRVTYIRNKLFKI